MVPRKLSPGKDAHQADMFSVDYDVMDLVFCGVDGWKQAQGLSDALARDAAENTI